MIGMTVKEVSTASGFSETMIEQVEAAQISSGADVIERLRVFFESHGIVFLASGDGGGGPGLRLRNQPSDEGIRPQNLNATNDD